MQCAFADERLLQNGTTLMSTSAAHVMLQVTHYPTPNQDAAVCQAACDADHKCMSWTWVERGEPAGSHDCCLKGDVPCPVANPTCTSGAKVPTNVTNCGSGPPAASTVCTIDYTPPANSSVTLYAALTVFVHG